MPPELAEVREWLRKAQHDRRLAEAGLAQTPPITDGAAFHCQQAVEKCLKAYLVHGGEPFERIHDLEALIDQCARLETEWDQFRDRVESLAPYQPVEERVARANSPCSCRQEAGSAWVSMSFSTGCYAVRFRYPGPADPSVEEVEEALGVV